MLVISSFGKVNKFVHKFYISLIVPKTTREIYKICEKC